MKTQMTFEVAIERTLGIEDGYVNNPGDPGGETKWGISRRSYPNVDIKNLTREQAKSIYLRDFWMPVVTTVSSPALQYQVLDAAVNHGMGNAVRMLQCAAGVAQDGHWGPISKAKLEAMDPADSQILFIAAREEFWASLSTFDKFGRGWMRRGVADLRYLAQDN
jgi:lysozyme family protein